MEPTKRGATPGADALRHWVVYLTAAASCCVAFVSSKPQSVTPVGARSGHVCAVVEKPRLFVGFAAGMTVDDFEVCAAASRRILSGVRAWLCETHASAAQRASYTRHLSAALGRGDRLQVDEVQFDDATALHAHVVVRNLVSTRARSGWHVHLEPSAGDAAEAWRVTRASDVRLKPDDSR